MSIESLYLIGAGAFYVFVLVFIAFDLRHQRRKLIDEREAAGDHWWANYLREKWKRWC